MVEYKIIRADRASTDLQIGDIVYNFNGCTYGIPSDDSRFTGIEHTALTKNVDGSSPFFTIPVFDVIKL